MKIVRGVVKMSVGVMGDDEMEVYVIRCVYL